MKTRGWAVLTGAGLAAALGVAGACSDDAASPPSGVEAGIDQGAPTPSPTTSGTTTPPEADAETDAGDAGRAIWAFNDYCGDPVDASCPTYDACPSGDGGGIAATECPAPFRRCLQASDAGFANRILACEPTGSPAWELNRLCEFEDCSTFDAGGACDAVDGGLAGTPCTTPLSRCIQSDHKVFVCQPGDALVNVFNGYCDAGSATPACDTSFDACAPSSPGVAGSACTQELARCLLGEKIFVCAQR